MESIKNDISMAHHVAVILDETSDVSNKSQLSTTLRIVNIVKENSKLLVDFFKNILNNSSDWESETVALARGYLSFLSEFETKFLLNVLSKIYAYIDILYNILQTKHLDILYCVEEVNETKRIVLHERYRFDALWSDVCNEVECEEVPRKRKCLENDLPSSGSKIRRVSYFIGSVTGLTGGRVAQLVEQLAKLATDWKVRGSIPGGDRIFSRCQTSRTAPRFTQPPIKLSTGSFPGVKGGQSVVPTTPPQSSAEVMESMGLYFHAPQVPSWHVTGIPLPFLQG
ncbi:hypothetical protein ANN_18651 [Periplaneta americana]|uniref:DUF4371 domain-containing protein n=1 Tax=Periplaneta americana TaxID=6978 RepID=A0ABQ8SQM4_PERAM|nr:hypothetical protein ANN_18651 [Periplaneta americana]